VGRPREWAWTFPYEGWVTGKLSDKAIPITSTARTVDDRLLVAERPCRITGDLIEKAGRMAFGLELSGCRQKESTALMIIEQQF
jgi:hypothetical protein